MAGSNHFQTMIRKKFKIKEILEFLNLIIDFGYINLTVTGSLMAKISHVSPGLPLLDFYLPSTSVLNYRLFGVFVHVNAVCT